MELLLLEGWLPIILAGVISTVVIVMLSRVVSNRIIYAISSLLFLVCIFFFLYSIFVVGGWGGMGLGFFSIAVFLGVLIGSLIGVFMRKGRI